MPEPAGARNLEEILASIRKSLADESVDGIVQLSAAAAAAARAEAGPAEMGALPQPAAPQTAAEVLADDLLRDKLAGALTIGPELDLEDRAIFEEQEPRSQDGAAIVEPSREQPTPDLLAITADDVTVEVAPASEHMRLWFLRPGAQNAEPEPPAPEQHPEPVDRATPPVEPRDAAAAVFALSPRQLMGADGGPAQARLKQEAELLDKLRAANAAAIGNMARAAADAPPGEALEAPSPAAQHEATLETDTARSADPAASAREQLAPEMLITRPERHTPLFGGSDESPRRIIASAGLDLVVENRELDAPEARPAELVVEAAETVQVERAVADELPATLVEPEPLQGRTLPQQGAEPEGLEGPGPEPQTHVEEAAAVVYETSQAHQSAEASEQPEPPAEAERADLQGAPQAAADAEPTPQPLPPPQPQPQPQKSLEDMIAAVLEPVLHRLIEKNLGPAVEAIVQREVAKALAAAREKP